MDKRENRDDLIKRVIDHTEQTEKRHTNAKEKEQIAEYIKSKIMPEVYEKDAK